MIAEIAEVLSRGNYDTYSHFVKDTPGKHWRHVKQRITPERIQDLQSRGGAVALTTKNQSRLIHLDFDNHGQQLFIDQEIDRVIQSVINSLGVSALIQKSPNGQHVFLLFDRPVRHRFKRLASIYNYELISTPTKPGRFPRDFTGFLHLEVNRADEVFNTLPADKGSIQKLYTLKASHEAGALEAHQTNKYIISRAWQLKRAGHNNESIAQMIYFEIAAHGLTKPNTGLKALRARVKCLLKDYKKPRFNNSSLGLFDDVMGAAIYKALHEIAPDYFKHKKIQNNAKRFCRELIRWIDYIKDLSYDCRLALSETYKCFFYYTYRKKLIPIPQRLFLRWYGKGNNKVLGAVKLMELLKVSGIIQREVKPYHDYSGRSNAGRCTYYAVKLPQII